LIITSYSGDCAFDHGETFPPNEMEYEGARSQNPSRSLAESSKPLALDYAPPPQQMAQNVMFSDMSSGGAQSVGSSMDPLRDDVMMSDASLDTFFSRPVKIAAFDWEIGSNLSERFDPWSLYWENSLVSDRISRYKLLRATMKVKFVINGNPFFFGRAIASYEPLPTQDNLTIDRGLFDQDVIAASQRPHIFLNPTESAGGEIELPFFTYLNVLDIAARDWRTMGEIVIHSLQNLKHANGAVGESITVSVFAWAENVKFSVPTSSDPGSVLPYPPSAPSRTRLSANAGTDEYGTGPISRPASVISKVASSLKSVPVISNFALATQMGASAVSKIASIFGYSAPASIDVKPWAPMARSSLAATNRDDEVIKLSVDSKQELSIDPAVGGLHSHDELSITSISTRESFLTSFDWAVGTAEETLLFNARVDPGLHGIVNTAPLPEIHLTASAFAVMPFQYWRGSMRFRFQIVASSYHKGRLKIVYDPTAGANSVGYNTAYTTIVDISSNKDFTYDVGWAQSTPWREHFTPNAPVSSQYGTLALPSANIGNGVLSVYVVNELTTPNSTTNNDIEVNVFVSTLDDFEVAGPTNTYLDGLYLNQSPVDPPETAARLSACAGLDTEDGTAPTDPAKVNSVAAAPTTDPIINKVHFGEVIGSFRQMLKRYNYHEAMTLEIPSASDATFIEIFRQAMPFDGGWLPPDTTSVPDISVPIGEDNYVYAKTPLLRYLVTAYGGWRGGIRYLLDTNTRFATGQDRTPPIEKNTTFSLSRTSQNLIGNIYTAPNAGQFSIRKTALEAQDDNDGKSGTTRWTSSVNSLHAFELPYYSRFRFAPAKRRTLFDGLDPFQGGFKLSFTDTNGAANVTHVWHSYVAAAEDFTCMFYLGPPVYFYEASIPEPNPVP
jgi:hypothetical protein